MTAWQTDGEVVNFREEARKNLNKWANSEAGKRYLLIQLFCDAAVFSARERKPYTKPALTTYGRIAYLTRAAGASGGPPGLDCRMACVYRITMSAQEVFLNRLEIHL